MGVAGSPEVLTEIVLGVGGIGYEQREDARPADLDRGNNDKDDACYQARLWTHLAPFSPYLPLFLRLGTPGKDAIHEVDSDVAWRGVCSCSTTNSLTCSLPTSSSSMSRRSILPRFTASARIARAPIATAPAALAPTPKAPRAVHASPVATRAKATCAPNLGCATRLAVRVLCIILSFLQPRSSVAGFDPFHHNHDATSRSPARNFRELRQGEVHSVVKVCMAPPR